MENNQNFWKASRASRPSMPVPCAAPAPGHVSGLGTSSLKSAASDAPASSRKSLQPTCLTLWIFAC